MAAIADGLGMTEGTEMERERSEEEATEPQAGSQPATDDQAGGGEEPEVGPDGQPVGPDNIREGTVGGVMGGPHRQGGEGQGG
jgi:hypothetical protein